MLLESAAFLCGMSIMIIELIGARMLSPIFGNSHHIWAGVIGVVMTAMSLGYFRGGILADRNKSVTELSGKIFLAGLATFATPSLITVFSEIFLHTLGWKFGAVATAFWSMSVPCYWLAMVSPYCIRLLAGEKNNMGKVTGRIYGISTLGSILGVFTAGFFLIPNFSVRLSMHLLGAGLMGLAALVRIKSSGFSIYRTDYIAFGVFFVLIYLLTVESSSSQVIRYMPGSNIEVLASGQTAYNSISIVETDLPAGRYRLMVLGNLIQGGVNVETKSSYYRYVDHIEGIISENADLKDVLVLGYGAGVTSSLIGDMHPDAQIDAVDIDEGVFDYALAYFGGNGNLTALIVDDARLFLKNTDKTYDLIVMDVYGATHIVPFHITTLQMNRLIYDRMNPRGIYVMNIVSATEGPKSGLFKSQLKTLEQVFRFNYVVHVDDPKTVNTVLLISSKKGLDMKKGMIKSSSQYDTSSGIVLTDDFAPVEEML